MLRWRPWSSSERPSRFIRDGGVLQAEHEPAAQVALGPDDLDLGQPVAGDLGEHRRGSTAADLVEPLRRAARVDGERAGVGVPGPIAEYTE